GGAVRHLRRDGGRGGGGRRGGDRGGRGDHAVQVRPPLDAGGECAVDAVERRRLERDRRAGRGGRPVGRLGDGHAGRRVADTDRDRLGRGEIVAVGHRRGDDVAAGGEACRGDGRPRAERAGDV